jgi:hypothetical protein
MNVDNNNEERFPLDEHMIALLTQLNEQILAIQAMRNGALLLFLRQHDLAGAWRIADNQKEILRMPNPTPVPGSALS